MIATVFKGSMPALVTPFSDGDVDMKTFEAFVDWQITEGSHGLVPVGTTGESPTLTHDEHNAVVEACVNVAQKRVPVIAGAGSNSTAEAISLAEHAEKAGADGLLVVTPYYNKPNQEGLYRHYSSIAKATSLPIIIYNIPPRSVIDMDVGTMKRLFDEFDNIVGVKDATAKLDRVSIQRHELGNDFIQLSGEDATALGYNAHGGHGCISVTANVAPRLCAEFQEASLGGDYQKALSLQDKLLPLHKALFMEPSPGGAKYALSALGKMGNELRSPLCPVSKEAEAALDTALRHAGLLN